jgi:hypothetical protein
MPSWWRRLTGSRSRPPLVCYLRENGPIAYELPLFDADPRATVEAMLATGLAWYWRANSSDWTQLTRWSLAAFLGDAGQGRELAIGIDAADAPAGAVDRGVAGWLRAFAADTATPLHVLVDRRPDGDRVFVAQQPAEPVRDLLVAWGIDRGKAVRRAYARLRGESLEDVIRSLA